MPPELRRLAAELDAHDTVTNVEIGETGIVKIDVSSGQYDSLVSEVVSILGRYDCDVYSHVSANDYWICPV